MYITYELCNFVSDLRATVTSGVERMAQEAGTVIPLMAGKVGFQYLFSRRQPLEDGSFPSPALMNAPGSDLAPLFSSASASRGLKGILWNLGQTALLSAFAVLCRGPQIL